MSTTPTSTTPTVDHAVIAAGFKASVEGKMPADQLQSATTAMATAATGYAANGSIASLLFYMQVQVTIKGGKTFDGKAGGIGLPGGGALFGTVYTDDINRLYANTKSFAFQATPVYFAVEFFDGSSNYLGTFQAGAVSIVTGTGGGSGHWS
jgi:hypothetical protein